MSTIERSLLAGIDPVRTFETVYRTPPIAWQPEYLREGGNVFTVKGRQVGASTGAASLAIHQAKYFSGSLSVIISPSQKQSQEIAIRAKAGIRNIEKLPLEQESASVIRFNNGSRILSLPGTATSVRGYSAQLLIVDEAAFVEEETWVAARALVATGGRVLVQSTPLGAAGWFFDLWKVQGSEWRYFKVPSWEMPTVSKEFLEQERLRLGEYLYLREYGAEFGVAGVGLFDPERLRQMDASESLPFFEELRRRAES